MSKANQNESRKKTERKKVEKANQGANRKKVGNQKVGKKLDDENLETVAYIAPIELHSMGGRIVRASVTVRHFDGRVETREYLAIDCA